MVKQGQVDNMKDFDIRNIFCSDRLRRLSSEHSAPAARKTASYSKENLKKSMNDLLSEIVSSISPDVNVSSDSFNQESSDNHVLH